MILLLNGNRRQERHLTALRHLLETLLSRPELTIMATERYASTLATLLPDLARRIPSAKVSGARPDLMLSIGGDGTLLKTAVLAAPAEVPVFGVNCGHLGYLTFDGIDNADNIIRAIVTRSYTLEPRTMLRVQVPGMEHTGPYTPYALNEVAILKRDSASMVNLDTHIDGTPLTVFRADGLLISTPTGSTGYNLSAGGPILTPDAPVLSIAPVAPHSLSMRPLVINDSCRLTVTPSTRADTFLLALDGRSTPLPDRTPIEIYKAPFRLLLARPDSHTFADTLRDKLYWGLDNA